MGSFNQCLTRIRRFLRDPDAAIWDDDQVRIYFNDGQLEIAQKIDFIERIGSYRYPPLYTWSYQRDWEVQHVEGDLYQALNIWPTRDLVVCYPWEPGYYLATMSTVDEGSRFTHPWEAVYCTPADVVKIPLHTKFNKMKFAAFDEEKIEPQNEREISSNDQYYKTVSGQPVAYYRTDEYENDLILYPRPSSVVWDETNIQSDTPTDAFPDNQFGVIYTYGYQWEWEVAILTGDLNACCEAWAANDMVVTYVWEPHYTDTTTDTDTDYHYLQPWETNYTQENRGGLVSYQEDSFDESDTGVIVDTLDTENNLFMVFEAIPEDVPEEIDTWDEDISWWPPYMIPIVEYATLERCFGADTDGFIPSLRDYWELRKKVGIETIKQFKHNRLTDRDYRMGGTIRRSVGHPRLPSGYPAI